MQAVKDGVLPVRLCHRTGSVSFGVDVFVHKGNTCDEGPRLQSLQSEMMRSQLTSLSRSVICLLAPSILPLGYAQYWA